MKHMVIFQLIVVILLCLSPIMPLNYFTPIDIHYYSLDTDFTLQEALVIEQAIDHFDNKIKCIELVNIDGAVDKEKINKNMILDIHPARTLEGSNVGVYHAKTHSIFVARYSKSKKSYIIGTVPTKLSSSFRFKIMLHEVAHAMGMPGSPHPMKDSKTSHFSPIIDKETYKYLSKIDIRYLRELICKNRATFTFFPN